MIIKQNSSLAPKILIPRHKLFTAQLGQYLEVPCQALTSFSDSFSTIIYWLANQEFIEDKFTDMRVRESNESFHTKNGQNFVKRNLLFTQIKSEDFHTNFTCIVMNPEGVSVQSLHLVKHQLPWPSARQASVKMRE
ncbi:interleukin-1 receptor type 2-like isoform X2 [Callorhinchus milii]|uniref:interleukin-1 receptor type 2-like isoform X2 n=1 Tax=Callorhinchus milii TaxID=7868 RepID=UPI001C3F996C|nr:interleukin-1 receptor type 2-like isoform X2 [Callorhinchus milii]